MGISIVSEPGFISLSKNPCEFHLRTDNWITTQPVAGVWDLTFTTKLSTIGAYHLLEFDGHSVAFYVASTTTPNGYNLPDDIASTTLDQYVAALADTWFPAQYLIDKYFTVEFVSGPILRLTAKDPNTELTITTTTPGGQASWSTTTAAAPMETRPDYYIILDVEVEEIYGSGNYTRIGTLHAAPDVYDDSGTLKGDVKFDVAELLHGFLQDKTDKPALGFPTATAANNTHLQWHAIWAQRYTILNEVVTITRVQSDLKQVLKGGLKYLDVPTIPDLENDFYGLTAKPFQTWQPDGKQVTAAEPHFLYFLTDFQITGPDYYELTATVYYTDGTTDTSVINTNAVAGRWDVYYYRVGFEVEGLNLLQPTKTPYKYTVQLTETGGGMASEVRTFYLVDETRQDRFFLYENSFGAWETLRCNGDMEAVASVAKTEAANLLQAGYAATDAIIQQKSQGYEDAFTVFTGYKSKAEAIHLREFINSENYFEVIDGYRIPVVVDAGSFKLEFDKTGDYAYGLKFNYRHAFINKGHSNA